MAATSHSERSRKASGIEINEDLVFQHRMWRIERVGWWGFGAILVAAAAGLFGHGPLSRTTVELLDSGNRGGFMLEYERFGRAHGESQFRFSGRPPTVEQGTFSLWLSADYMADAELLRITPDPASQEVASDGVRYRFRRRDGTSPQIIIFRFKPERPGSLSGSFRLNDGPPSSFRQWLAP